MMLAQKPHFEWTLSELLAGVVPVSVSLADNVGISGMAQHTGCVQPGDLFVALAGTQTHGLQYLNDAIQRGAAAVVWEPHVGIKAPDASCPIPLLRIPELGQRVGVLADRFYHHPSRDMSVMGVTGTDGKTSVSQFIAQSLHTQNKPCGVIGTLGYGVFGELVSGPHTTPQAIVLQRELSNLRHRGVKQVVMEASSHGLQQGRVNGTGFDVAVLTNLSRDHFDYHGNLIAYTKAKRRLFEMPGLQHAVLNLDDAFGRKLAVALDGKVECMGYTLGGFSEEAIPQIRATHHELGTEGMRLEIDTPWGRGELITQLLGRFNAANLLAALAVLLKLDFSLQQALQRLAEVQPVAGRMEAFGGTSKPLVVVDYAHTPAALEQALTALHGHCHGRLWCIFGCGGERDLGKRPQMAQVAERLADALIITDDNPRHEAPNAIVSNILTGLANPQAATVIHDRARAIATTIKRARQDDIVLVAGKGHEEFQLVGDQKIPFSDPQQVAECLG